jgi:hypothetical protein
MAKESLKLGRPLYDWKFIGRPFLRGKLGEFDHGVTADPCIIWDDSSGKWLMYYFAEAGAISGFLLNTAMAISKSATEVGGVGDWTKLGKAKFVNPDALWEGNPHKPWIMMDPYNPNHAAKINGKYNLFFVNLIGRLRVIQRAESESLYGPWLVQKDPILNPDKLDAFDGYWTDTVTAYWFEKQGKILFYYKGYPQYPQADQIRSPIGSSAAAAYMEPGDRKAVKLGKIIPPSNEPSSWYAGWVSTLQIFPAEKGGWYGLTIGSPTPPASIKSQPYMREPCPSLGGWAYCPEEFPIKTWKMEDRPICWVNELSEEAFQSGERVYLFRHHLLMLDNGEYYLYYNSGAFSDERLFVHKYESKK